MFAVPGVTNVHDLHIWTITSGFPALAAHVLVERVLDAEFEIDHTTLQVDHASDRLLSIERGEML